MKQTRFVQNFRGSRALVCAAPGPSVATLTAILPKLALVPEIVPVQPGQQLVLPDARTGDILLLDGDLVLPDGWTSPDGTEVPPPCPVVGLVGSEAPSRLRALAQLGAKSFLPKPVHGGSVYSALFLAVNEFNLTTRMQSMLDELHDRRRKRAHVLRAVVRLVQREGLDGDAAYDRLRREAMRARVSVETYCQSLHAAGDDDEDPSTNDRRRQA
ncbi:ANTAR domain-containing response regulator [Paracoccus laeviglucosivorans]|uniref:ANTAR domain-containing protein n=1 Tax=Paracoccus laeviglucosivorans TaxID=1197861 RepID=A0A521FBZ2_9RHOB|nr:ANTAR domain-containing protein [Paracoccus laeviglucosivorans]SMO93673.1 ANTAR domain-containing protein [Paracoccus laeviglucosivorans]